MAPNGKISKSQDSKEKSRTTFVPVYFLHIMVTMRVKLQRDETYI